jgi:hypothetical protein
MYAARNCIPILLEACLFLDIYGACSVSTLAKILAPMKFYVVVSQGRKFFPWKSYINKIKIFNLEAVEKGETAVAVNILSLGVNSLVVGTT